MAHCYLYLIFHYIKYYGITRRFPKGSLWNKLTELARVHYYIELRGLVQFESEVKELCSCSTI